MISSYKKNLVNLQKIVRIHKELKGAADEGEDGRHAPGTTAGQGVVPQHHRGEGTGDCNLQKDAKGSVLYSPECHQGFACSDTRDQGVGTPQMMVWEKWLSFECYACCVSIRV